MSSDLVDYRFLKKKKKRKKFLGHSGAVIFWTCSLFLQTVMCGLHERGNVLLLIAIRQYQYCIKIHFLRIRGNMKS